MHNLLKPTVKTTGCKLLPIPTSSATTLFALARISMTSTDGYRAVPTVLKQRSI